MKRNLLPKAIGKMILLFAVITLPGKVDLLAQDAPAGYTQGVVWKGQPGVQKSLQQIIDNEAYLVKHNLIKKTKNRRVENNEKELRKPVLMDPNSPAVSTYKDPSLIESTEQAPASSFDITMSFDAVNLNDITQGWRPPDPMMACGPKQLMVTVNGRIRVFDKSSGAQQYDINADVFFQDVRGSSNAVDPRVVYDFTSKRWFISSITNSFSNNRVLVAVSSGSVLTPQTTFHVLYFQQNKVGPSPNIDDGLFADYETLGVDANAVYIGCNMFNSTLHTSVFVLKKSDLINGTITATAFRNIGNSSTGGPWTPQGVTNLDPAATEGYFVGTDFNVQGRLVVRRIINPGGTPSISGNLNITVPTTASPLDAPNKNGFPLDALDYRLMQAMINKNATTGEVSLWTAHAILVNSSGVGTSSGDRDAVRWYQVGNLTTTPSLLQSGTLFDGVSTTNPKFFWMGTISMNKRGDAMISCSVASKDIGGNGAVAVHYSTGTAGSISNPKATTSSNTANFDGRWGDYSASVIDPSDNTTFWGVHEYMGTSVYTIKVVKVTVTPSPSATGSIIDQVNDLALSVSPNPVADKMHVILSRNIDKELAVTITNQSGTVLLSDIVREGNSEFDENISRLPAGQYWINVSTADGLINKSVLFEKE